MQQVNLSLPKPRKFAVTVRLSYSAAIGGYKWDTLPRHLRPETGSVGTRERVWVYLPIYDRDDSYPN
jgi:hypothetical protein